MKREDIKAAPGLLLLCAFLASVTIAGASVTELNVPPHVVQGDTLSISGKTLPNEAVWLDSSFEISLPVSDGRYSEAFRGINFIAGEKKISARAENIKNIQMVVSPFTATCNGETVKVTMWPGIPVIETPLKITNGIVTLSFSFPMKISGFVVDIPPGKKDIKISGDATDGASSVNLEIATSIKVTANSNGDFLLDIDTEGVPEGEFLITTGGIERTVQIVLTEHVSGPVESLSSSQTPSLSPTPDHEESLSPGQMPSPSPTPDHEESLSPGQTPSPSPTPEPEESPSPSQTSSPTPTPSPKESPSSRLIPGLEAFFTIAALLAVAYLVLTFRRN